jgi:AcrR family transcriptional regulator
MSRTTDNKLKEEILDKVIYAMSCKGLNNLSLRDLARELDTSARMLIYHFGSYDDLIQSIFMHLSGKHKSTLKQVFAGNRDKTFVQISQLFIESVFFPENKKPLLLFLELYTKALRDTGKYRSFFEVVLQNWIDEIEKMISQECGKQSRFYATMIMSFIRGLMMDWLATDDVERIYEANRVFSDLVAGLMKEHPFADE